MARVDVVLNGRSYPLACEDGQEPRLRELAALLDSRLREAVLAAVGGSEAQHLVLAALTLADELADLREAAAAAPAPTPATPAKVEEATDPTLISAAERVDALTARIENIAHRLSAA